MRLRSFIALLPAAVCSIVILCSCAGAPIKQYYIMNYIPEDLPQKRKQGPYPYCIRVKKFNIEEAYARPQIVYRKSPFEMRYYFYRVWAVKPTDMISDLVAKHLTSSGLVSSVIRRYDEGAPPQYEISGTIEAIEEYDNDEIWFAHLAFRIHMTRLSDNRLLYTRRFDDRKQVRQREPEFVVRELSRIMDVRMTQALMDIDKILAREYGLENEPAPAGDVLQQQQSEPVQQQTGPGFEEVIEFGGDEVTGFE